MKGSDVPMHKESKFKLQLAEGEGPAGVAANDESCGRAQLFNLYHAVADEWRVRIAGMRQAAAAPAPALGAGAVAGGAAAAAAGAV